MLKKRTVKLLGNIDKIKSQLIRQAGQGLDPKTHTVKKPLDRSSTGSIMKSEAPELGKQLNRYPNWLKSEFKDLEIPQFALLGEGLPEQSFYQSYYKGATVLEALLHLTHHQAVVLRYEAEVLKKLGAGFYPY